MNTLARLNSNFQRGDKKILYSQLSELYFLPPRDSTGVTKDYLDKVKAGTVFRVGLLELNKFLAELRPSQLKRALHTCKFEAYVKIDRLLAERRCPRLGFEEGQVPDGTWLYKVARYFDRANFCGLFNMPLVPPEREGQTNTDRLYHAQREAERCLLVDTGLGKRAEIKTCIEALQQVRKRLISRQAEHANLVVHVGVLEGHIQEDKQTSLRLLASTSVLVYQVGKRVTLDEAMAANDEEKKGVEEALRLVYCTDCVLDRGDEVGRLADQFTSSGI